MNILSVFLVIASFLVFLSLVGVSILWSRLSDLHKEKPYIIPLFLHVAAFFIMLIHILSFCILIGLIFYAENIKTFLESF